MNQGFPTSEIVFSQNNGVGQIILNRPAALHALSLEMIREISAILKKWEEDDTIQCVVFRGDGDRAFCSGGDVKSFYNSGMGYRRGQVDQSIPRVFFAEEYSLNKQIFHYSKPTIAFMNGITMGGGYGIAGHCQSRIATEKTVFAMPEVAIGFFPDVGAAYHLNRAPENFGRYLALTGQHIGPGEMLAADLADIYMELDDYGGLIEALESAQGGDAGSVCYKLSKPCPDAQVFGKYGAVIADVFAPQNVADMFEKLRKAGGSFAEETFNFFAKVSPLSVCVTLRHLDVCQGLEFDGVMEEDFLRAQRFIEYPDLYEGIRAALIQKDKTPLWEPETFNQVSEADINRYFKPTGYLLADVKIFAA